ncbi:MAG: adenylate/guanylate cyclase domain-containing protein [Chloroflexota bacterium]
MKSGKNENNVASTVMTVNDLLVGEAQFPSYAVLRRKIDVANVVTILSGAVASMLYLATLAPLSDTQQTASTPLNAITVIIFVLFMIGAFWLGGYLTQDRQVPVGDWYERLRRAEANAHPPLSVQRYIIFWPMRQTLGTAVIWVLAGLFFGILAAMGSGFWDGLQNFIAITVVGGTISSVLLYFTIDWLWRPVVALFLAGGNPRQISSFYLPVFGRLLIAFLLIGILPPLMLVLITGQRLSLLATASNPDILLANLRLIQYFIFFTGLLASIGIAVFMARGIIGPLESLQAGMARVEQNDFGITIPVTSGDELGYLTFRFNQMTSGLRQGELMRNLLNLYVSPEVARNALENGAELGGQLVTCSVLFADIRDFTTISERLAPQMLMKLLNQYMSEMVEVIVQHGGMVNKFGGDSLLAVFGTPLNPQPDHARQAVRTAQAMFVSLAAFNASQAQISQPQLRIGVGIATGPVVAGNVGGQERLEYTVIGDTVNLASRLQDKTKELPGNLLISEMTYQALGDELNVAAERLTAVTVKGKRQPISVYAISD